MRRRWISSTRWRKLAFVSVLLEKESDLSLYSAVLRAATSSSITNLCLSQNL